MASEKYIVNQEKVDQAVELMKEYGIDTWLILTRENTDPSLPLMVGVRSVHKGAIFLNSNGEHFVLTSVSDQASYEETGIFKEVIAYHSRIEEPFLELMEKFKPKKMALNISLEDHLADGLTVGQYQWLEGVLGKDRLREIEVSSENLVQNVRSIKSEAEISRIQKAIEITQDIYNEVFQQLKPGMTEREIGELFIKGLKKRKVTSGIGPAFQLPIVCSVRLGLAHREPSKEKVLPGDMLVMDFSVKYQDYVSDIARTAYFLRPGEEKAPPEVQKAFDTAVEAVTAAIEVLLPGKKGYEVDAAGRKVIEEAGYPTIRHSTGHQIGRDCHDGGTGLGPRRNPPRLAVEREVQAGEVYAVEPTVIQDGGLPSVIVEENVLVTKEGPKILSKRQTELVTIPAE